MVKDLEEVKKEEQSLALCIGAQMGTDVVMNLIGREISAFDTQTPEESTASLVVTAMISKIEGV